MQHLNWPVKAVSVRRVLKLLVYYKRLSNIMYLYYCSPNILQWVIHGEVERIYTIFMCIFKKNEDMRN